MIVYRATKKGFVDDVINNRIADEINDAFYAHLGRGTSPNEKRSWKNSMMFMSNVVNNQEIPDDLGIAIEYQIPLTSKRVDFIISGLNEEKKGSVVIVELKQWEKAKLTTKSGIVSTRFQHGEHETTHPSYQAWSYAYMLENYNATVREENISMFPCAYLHNYVRDNVIDNSFYSEYIDKAPLFFKSDVDKLKEFIKSNIKYGSKNDIVWYIDQGKLKPSKQLADSLSSMLKGNREFVLIDDQKVVYETALRKSQLADKEGKQVLIVEGGPGTGKSVVAINLLVQLTKLEKTVQYVTKNSAPREVYCAKLKGEFRKRYIDNLFVGSGRFSETPKDSFDALVVDEAHRLNLKSGLYSNIGENQVKEIINAAKFSVFFVDDRQRIHIKDIGSKRSIQKYAEELGAKVSFAKLSSQFRCNGSDGYLNWLDNTLQIKETANIRLSQEDYDFKIFDDPNDMYNAIEIKNSVNNKSRVVAGYCWDWKSKSDSSAFDIEIPSFNFRRRWNLREDGSKWIISPNSINEIGCIHTCQGLELDYVGVIVGEDIRYENGRVVTDLYKRSNNDQSIRGFKGRFKKDKSKTLQDVEEIIKNTYRTLMTRGMKGCYVYFCDEKLAQHFRNKLEIKENEETNIVRIEPIVNDDVKYVDFLPLYSLKAACGYFGEGEVVEELGWVRAEGLGKLNRNMFVVQAVGHSMEPRISDGDYCVFRVNPAGSRQGKIVLVQHNSYDADNEGSFSIKTYTSEKTYNEYGEWHHESIILKPLNKEYNDIVIDEDDSDDFRVIGEYLGSIESCD